MVGPDAGAQITDRIHVLTTDRAVRQLLRGDRRGVIILRSIHRLRARSAGQPLRRCGLFCTRKAFVQPAVDLRAARLQPEDTTEITGDRIGVESLRRPWRALGHHQRRVQDIFLQPKPACLAGDHVHQLLRRVGKHFRPDPRHFCRAQGVELCADFLLSPARLRLCLGPAALFKLEIPDLVGILHIDPQPRIQPRLHQLRKSADIGIIRQMRHVYPDVLAQSIGQRQHHLQRHPMMCPASVPHLRTVLPTALV